MEPCNGEVVKIVADEFHYVLFGGDQLTAERATGAKQSINNENRGYDRFEWLVPVIEDWHAKVCFLKMGSIIVFNDVNKSIGYNGKYCTAHHLESILAHYSNFVI